MNEDTVRHEHGSGAAFEHQDLSPKNVYAFLGGLGLACVLVALFLWGFYAFLDAKQKAYHSAQSPLVPAEASTREVNPAVTRTEIVARFPQPRLESNERVEINDFLLQQDQTLHSYGWVDEKSGVVRIPIDRAMQLLAQRGLPTTPRTGVAPASEINTVNQAAKRSDTANSSPARTKDKKK